MVDLCCSILAPAVLLSRASIAARKGSSSSFLLTLVSRALHPFDRSILCHMNCSWQASVMYFFCHWKQAISYETRAGPPYEQASLTVCLIHKNDDGGDWTDPAITRALSFFSTLGHYTSLICLLIPSFAVPPPCRNNYHRPDWLLRTREDGLAVSKNCLSPNPKMARAGVRGALTAHQRGPQ